MEGQKKINRTFNDYFSIKDNDAEHLNILLENDLEAFIDPYHIANNLDKRIAKKMYVRSSSFLRELNGKYIVPIDRKNGLKFLSPLREANEYHLGYSESNKGKGIGPTKAELIFNSLSKNKFAKAGISITNEAHNVLLLVEGIGQDNMSDTLANICRDILADFTLSQCVKYGIKTSYFKIEYFDQTELKWKSKTAQLPSHNGKPIILVPQYLTSGQRIYQNHYNWFVSSNFISKDIMNGKIGLADNGRFVLEKKDGSKKPIVKKIHEHYRKPKKELIEFVKTYNGSLQDFLDYAKLNYPSIDKDQLTELYKKAS